MAIQITVQNTPNPNAVKITANQVIFEGTGSTSVKSGGETEHPLAAALVAIDGVDNIFGIRDFVTVSKEPEADWDSIIPQVQEAFDKIYK